MRELKQSTVVTVKIGPFLDENDGSTAETGLTIAQADVRLSKNGGNMAQKTEASACSHDEIGMYNCPLDATDTGTLGMLVLNVAEAGALPVWEYFAVITAAHWNAKYAATPYATAANVTAAHSTTDTLIGALNNLSSAQAEAAATAALNAYDPPTKAEMDAVHATTDALIGALNNLSSAQAEAAATAALNSYDPPTEAEMAAAHAVTDALIGGLNNLSQAQSATAAAAALVSYDPPTKAEMDAVHAVTDALIGALNNLSSAQAEAAAAAALAAEDLDKVADASGRVVVAPAGLDDVSTTGPAGVAANFRERVNQIWRRFFGKATLTTTLLRTFRDDNSTPATDQVVSDDATTQTQDEATSI